MKILESILGTYLNISEWISMKILSIKTIRENSTKQSVLCILVEIDVVDLFHLSFYQITQNKFSNNFSRLFIFSKNTFSKFFAEFLQFC